ncbi:bifunctional glutamate N-acetyltransferase/amino-acid acetyltransferase ArgJ [Marinovum sp.]|uniref:bifunctional glutamate N-acetyltransferase/amino-acid acetyltransferase ArgJ n=1 Tax=Marinovum sp. TaxID=2024839 RepID=UPI002B2680B1|nr:bifunctional glutamate N-acetyltransferase/amino-acid acetyltransferase ArgJ [Marinovum sp.]
MAKPLPVSPLAPAQFPEMPVINGVTFASAEAGVRYAGRKDVMLALLAPGSAVAGVFTRSATRSAPVLDCQEKLGGDSDAGAAILVNAGNSNAFTGKRGEASVSAITRALAEAAGVPQARVFTSSTGVIGEPLPHERIIDVIDRLIAAQEAGAIPDAARAIMTTDTYPKGAARTVEIAGTPVQIAGIAKGSGMIAPDMATMLVYIFTDAVCAQPKLQAMLGRLTDLTFNCITVDSDTSTSDTLLLGATGKSGVDVADNAAFEEALFEVMMDLAHQVVRDGEGATKFVQIDVTGAASDAEAHTHAMAIANSPLVKTAIAGEDANWGRVVMAIGKSGAQADRDRITIRFGETLVAENGWVHPDYKEADAAAHMRGEHIAIAVDLGIGAGKKRVWTCDLTHGYIDINADYRS